MSTVKPQVKPVAEISTSTGYCYALPGVADTDDWYASRLLA
jgi:hypothetical protein